jgi:hypothetical protein
MLASSRHIDNSRNAEYTKKMARIEAQWQKTSLDKVNPTSYGLLDFDLFAATSTTGTFTKVETKATFIGANSLKLTYQAKTGQKLYYRVYPTWAAKKIDVEFGPVKSGNLGVDMRVAAVTNEYTLIPGIPQNIVGESIDFNKVRIAVEKGVAIIGYEVFDASTNKMLKRQKGNVFTLGATFDVNRDYKVRSFRLLGKTRIYSDFSAAVTVKPTLKTPSLTVAKVKNSVGSVKLSWKAINGVSSYEVVVDGVTYKEIGKKSTSITVTGLTAGTPCNFYIVAKRGTVAVPSNTVTFTP